MRRRHRARRSRSASRWRIDATAYRLVHGEADLLPSLIVDRYGDYLVVQALSQGMDRLLPVVVVGADRSAAAARASSRATIRRRAPLEGLEQRVDVLAGEVPDTVAVTRERQSNTTSTCGTARRPGCSSISARTARPRRATRAAGCSTASATTAASRCVLRPALRRDDRVRRVRGRGRAHHARTPRATASPVDARVGNVFDELRGLERAGRAVRHDRARPAGVRQEQGGGRRTRAPATRRSTCAR